MRAFAQTAADPADDTPSAASVPSSFETAEYLFMRNLPAESRGFLEMAIEEDPSNVLAHLFLGIVFEQLGLLDDALAVYRGVLDDSGEMAASVANNLGNVLFRMGYFDEAEELYSRAIELDAAFAPAHLGRANARLEGEIWGGALVDYESYLALEPDSPQREPIERMIASLRLGIEEAERQRLAAEQQERDEELRRLAGAQLAQLAMIAAETQRISLQIAALELERQRQEEERAVRIAADEEARLREGEAWEARLADIREEISRQMEEQAAELAGLDPDIQRQIADEVARLDAERQRQMDGEVAALNAEIRRLAEEQTAGLAELERERQTMLEEQAARLADIEGEIRRQVAEQTAMVGEADAERQRQLADEMARLDSQRERMIEEQSERLAEMEAEIMRQVAIRTAIFEEDAAEMQRLVTAEIARLEAARRQRLLDDISDSLRAAAEGSQGISVGAEGIETVEGEFELE